MIEVFVESIRMNMASLKRVVVLKEKNSDRYLPIWIGPFEADAIAIPLQNQQAPRPLTHDLLGSVISALDARVVSIVINDLADDTFFAKIVLDAQGRHLEVDSRPSDAIALALRIPRLHSQFARDRIGQDYPRRRRPHHAVNGVVPEACGQFVAHYVEVPRVLHKAELLEVPTAVKPR